MCSFLSYLISYHVLSVRNRRFQKCIYVLVQVSNFYLAFESASHRNFIISTETTPWTERKIRVWKTIWFSVLCLNLLFQEVIHLCAANKNKWIRQIDHETVNGIAFILRNRGAPMWKYSERWSGNGAWKWCEWNPFGENDELWWIYGRARWISRLQ